MCGSVCMPFPVISVYLRLVLTQNGGLSRLIKREGGKLLNKGGGWSIFKKCELLEIKQEMKIGIRFVLKLRNHFVTRTTRAWELLQPKFNLFLILPPSSLLWLFLSPPRNRRRVENIFVVRTILFYNDCNVF